MGVPMSPPPPCGEARLGGVLGSAYDPCAGTLCCWCRAGSVRWPNGQERCVVGGRLALGCLGSQPENMRRLVQ